MRLLRRPWQTPPHIPPVTGGCDMRTQPVPARGLLALLPFALLPVLSGCLVIEKKNLVMLIPGESKEIRMYYVFEGLSLLDDGDLGTAKRQLDQLAKDDLGFFILGTGDQPDNPFLKPFRFERLRFFTEPRRGRQLCA